mmetsp:Transcript_28192/g.87221  ORF Transcript_28192/g.87221 Transcript_28192/m.87221 type:complete len:325 (-) Transcript_28192:5098-6072(-)
MRMRGKLMEISNGGVLIVNYSSRLVQLLREVRQLADLGVTLPSDIKKVASEGEQYYRFGVMLRKVAVFFNNMDAQILKTQRPMLLHSLVAFEEIVEKRNDRGGNVEWSTPTACERYVERLQHAAAKLAHENRQLRRIHLALSRSLVSLVDIDMLTQRRKWRQLWQAVQLQIHDLSERYSVDRMRRWLDHWDHQIYKVLEAAYCAGLETINESLQLPESLRVELDFVSNSDRGFLRLEPGIEEIRSIYYRELKKFVAVPNAFKGFGGSNEVSNCQRCFRVVLRSSDDSPWVGVYKDGRSKHKVVGASLHQRRDAVYEARASLGAA